MAMNNIGIGITINVNAGQSAQAANQAANALNNVTKSGIAATRSISSARKEFANLAGAFVQMTVGRHLIDIFGALAMKSDEITMGMQRIKAVMGDGVFGAGGAAKVQNTIMNVGEAAGKSFKDVAEATKDLIAQGLSSDQVMLMLDPLMKFTRAGEISTDQATKLVVALTNMGITAQNTGGAFDIILNLANKSSLEVEDFAKIITKTGPIAQLTGVNFKDLAASTAILRRGFSTAAEQGTAMANTMQFLMRPKSEKKIREAFGIDVLDSTKTKLKPLNQLFVEVSHAIDKGKGSLQDLYSIFGSKTGAKVFSAGINSFREGMTFNEKTMKGEELFGTVRGEADSSQGAVAAAFGQQMQALTPQLDRLKVAFDNLIGTLGQSFMKSLAALVGGLADVLTGVRNFLSEHPHLTKALGFLIDQFAKVAAAIGLMLISVGGMKILKLALTAVLPTAGVAGKSFMVLSRMMRMYGASAIFSANATKLLFKSLLGPLGIFLMIADVIPSILQMFGIGEKNTDKTADVGKSLSETAKANAIAAQFLDAAAQSVDEAAKEFSAAVAKYTQLDVKSQPKLFAGKGGTANVADKVFNEALRRGMGTPESLFAANEAIHGVFEAASRGDVNNKVFEQGASALRDMQNLARKMGMDKEAEKLLKQHKEFENAASEPVTAATTTTNKFYRQGLNPITPGHESLETHNKQMLRKLFFRDGERIDVAPAAKAATPKPRTREDMIHTEVHTTVTSTPVQLNVNGEKLDATLKLLNQMNKVTSAGAE